MSNTPPSEEPGNRPESVGRYEITAALGRGAMGTVYRARDTVLDREVAVKIMASALLQDAGSRARFEREARIVARINHPNVVMAYDLGYHTDGSPFIAMELLHGQDLAHVLLTRPPDADESAAIALQVLAGLAVAHDQGVVHRDVKPANVFVTDDGKVKVMDFGVARLTTAAVTKTGAVIGTAHYMSPEQVSGGRVDARSDLFSVGCVLYQMLASRRPFEADNMLGVLYLIANSEPDFSLVPPTASALLPMLRQALSKDPAGRYATARDFARELQSHLRQNAQSPWARHVAEVVELMHGGVPSSGVGVEGVEASRGGPHRQAAAHSPLGLLLAPTAEVTAGADVGSAPPTGPASSLPPAGPSSSPRRAGLAPPRDRAGHRPRAGTIGAVVGSLVVVVGALLWWQAQPAVAPSISSPSTPPDPVAAVPSAETPSSDAAAQPAESLAGAAQLPPGQLDRGSPREEAKPALVTPEIPAPTSNAPPSTVPPSTAPPVTTPPSTTPPSTAPPVTTPPSTAPPVTTPPSTAPPVTAPPSTATTTTAPPSTPAPPVTTAPAAAAEPASASPLTMGATTGKRFDGRTLTSRVRLDFRVEPDSPSSGARSRVTVVLRNDGTSSVQVRQIVITIVSGDDRRSETEPGRVEVHPGQEATLLARTATWPSAPPWSMEVVVHTRSGETYTNTVSWQ